MVGLEQMKQKVLLLNLPNREQITRRYMCSYVSPESLLPPLELIAVGAIAREWKQLAVKLVDAIAERLGENEVAKCIREFQPGIIVGITGFECFQDDIDTIRSLKKQFPETIFILFGHYATHFPKETLIHSEADFVILGEPDLIFSELADALKGIIQLEAVKGIVYRKNREIIVQGSGSRIPDPNQLPIPAYDLLPAGKYYEPLLANPYGMIQTARGCPYQCNYCVKSFGTKLTTLAPERIVQEIKIWQRLFKVKSIRFIDDTFTINKKRIIELCRLMINERLGIEWACLSRTDNLDAELLSWMKRAGCRRIYFGMETGSQRMLDIYNKNVVAKEAMESLHLCRKAGIETAAFFMSGHPEEREDDFRETVQFAIDAKLNFASFNPLTPYPGTALYNELSPRINFSIYPYKNEWKDNTIYDDFDVRKKIFYKSFYMRPSYFSVNINVLLKNLHRIFNMGAGLLRYLWWDKKFVISGLKGAKDA